MNSVYGLGARVMPEAQESMMSVPGLRNGEHKLAFFQTEGSCTSQCFGFMLVLFFYDCRKSSILGHWVHDSLMTQARPCFEES